MTPSPEFPPDSIENPTEVTAWRGGQVNPPASGGTKEMPPTRGSIDLAYEQISREWRDTPWRQPLIALLTALDWQVRSLDQPHSTDEDLIRRISELRSQIWLSPER